MYPGIEGPNDDHDGGERLQTAPLNTLLGFDLETYQITLDYLHPSKKVPDGIMGTRKFS